MATTNLLQWNPTASNQETDAQYLADSQRADGAVDPSVFLSILANKAFYQWSTYLTALFQAFAAKGFTTSDSNLATLTATCANFLTTADVLPAVQNVAYSASVALNAASANGFYFQTMGGPLTITGISNLTPGQQIVMYYQQDGTGGRAVAFPAVMAGAAQPDPTANSVSLQVFEYDANTSKLRAATPLVSANGYWFPSLATFSSLTLASPGSGGQVLTNVGGVFVAANGPSSALPVNRLGSRSFNVQYQNTGLNPLRVSVSGNINLGVGHNASAVAYVGQFSASLLTAANSVSNGPGYAGVTFDVPPGWFYEVQTHVGSDTDSLTMTSWVETTY